jgi:hypothetical protein
MNMFNASHDHVRTADEIRKGITKQAKSEGKEGEG